MLKRVILTVVFVLLCGILVYELSTQDRTSDQGINGRRNGNFGGVNILALS